MGRKGNMWIYSKQSESVSDRVNNREISCAGGKKADQQFQKVGREYKVKEPQREEWREARSWRMAKRWPGRNENVDYKNFD